MISINNAEKYEWGDKCFGWHLLKTQRLSIIQEIMPPGTEEKFHKHKKAQQFFYILKGTATFILDGTIQLIKAGEGIHIHPNITHKIKNTTGKDLKFIVISEPQSHGDRLNTDEEK